MSAANWRPSSLPMMDGKRGGCGCFESAGSDFADAGNDRHEALRDLLKGDSALFDLLPEEDQAGVQWAADYVRLHAPMSDYELELEQVREFDLVTDEFECIKKSGTIDAACGPEVFDFKWRERDYTPQMAAYALIQFQRHGATVTNEGFLTVRVHVLFGATQRAQVLEFDFESARRAVLDVVEQLPGAGPTPCDYCGWCAKKVTCPALTDRANAVAAGREDWKLEQYHGSAIDDPDEMAKALRLAKVLAKWCKAVEHFAREMVIRQGLQLPGFELKEKAGKKYCSDVPEAYRLLGVPQEEFFKACDVRLNSSKKYPDKQGLTEIFAAQNCMKAAPAKRAVLKKLETVLKQGNASKSLVAVGSDGDEETEGEV